MERDPVFARRFLGAGARMADGHGHMGGELLESVHRFRPGHFLVILIDNVDVEALDRLPALAPSRPQLRRHRRHEQFRHVDDEMPQLAEIGEHLEKRNTVMLFSNSVWRKRRGQESRTTMMTWWEESSGSFFASSNMEAIESKPPLIFSLPVIQSAPSTM